MKYIIIILIFLVACSPSKKLKKAINTMKENPAALAELCADEFPAKDSLIKGDTITIIDTLTEGVFIEVPCDTVIKVIQCPPVKVITKTITVTDTIVRVDKSKEADLNFTIKTRDKTIGEQAVTINALQAKYDDMNAKRNRWRMIALILIGVIGLGIFLKLKRII